MLQCIYVDLLAAVVMSIHCVYCILLRFILFKCSLIVVNITNIYIADGIRYSFGI